VAPQFDHNIMIEFVTYCFIVPLGLVGCCRIQLNPHVLEWIGVELKLNFTPIHPTHVNWGEFDNTQTRPY
jgi:hypothetical protein